MLDTIEPQLQIACELLSTAVNWLLDLVQSSIYPGAPFQRCVTALKLYTEVVRVFSPKTFTGPDNFPDITGPSVVSILHASLLDSHDEIRALAYNLLNDMVLSIYLEESTLKNMVQRALQFIRLLLLFFFFFFF